MPPSLFKNTSTGAWTDVSTYNTSWRFDRYGTTPKEMVLVFENYPEDIELFTGSFVDINNTGNLAVAFEDYETDVQIFTGSFADVNNTGDIDCAFETFGCYAQAGLHLDCSMEPWDCAFYYIIEGEDMDNCEFRYWECEMTGSTDYVSMTCEFEPFEGAMYVHGGLNIAFPKWEFNGTGTNGIMANMDLVFRRFEFDGVGGGPISLDAEFEHFGFEATAQTNFLASMDLVFRHFKGEMSGDSGIVGHLDLRFRPFYATLDASDYISPTADLDVTFVPYQVGMRGLEGIDADLSGNSLFMDIQMTGYTDGPNSLDLVFELPEIEMGLEAEDCDLADTITFAR